MYCKLDSEGSWIEYYYICLTIQPNMSELDMLADILLCHFVLPSVAFKSLYTAAPICVE